jgi:hypothetical protein
LLTTKSNISMRTCSASWRILGCCRRGWWLHETASVVHWVHEVGASLGTPHWSRSPVVSHRSILSSVESPKPFPLFSVWIPDFSRVSAPRPSPHSSIPPRLTTTLPSLLLRLIHSHLPAWAARRRRPHHSQNRNTSTLLLRQLLWLRKSINSRHHLLRHRRWQQRCKFTFLSPTTTSFLFYISQLLKKLAKTQPKLQVP